MTLANSLCHIAGFRFNLYGPSCDDNFVMQAYDCRLPIWNYMLVPQKMISATSTALDNYGIVWIPLWSIALYNEVSPTWSYILVYSYLYFRASRLKVTRTESTLLDMHINMP